MSDRTAVEAAIHDLVARRGGVDALVNNAGMTLPATFLDQDDADWDRIVDVNLKGTFVMAQVAARQMVEQGTGASSTSARCRPTACGPAHRRTPPRRPGVEGLSRLMAVQLAPSACG